jgi:Domain of unknown function (DUF5076)
MRELQLPRDVIQDPAASEILRVWVKSETQGFVSRPDVWDDPAAWGLLLADLARHLAQGYARERGGDPAVVLSRIKAGLDAEWSFPTDNPNATRVE